MKTQIVPLAVASAALVLSLAVIQTTKAASFTNTGSLNTARYDHTATLLSSGKVIIAGGQNSTSFVTSADLYDQASGMWTTSGALNIERVWHTATLLPSGKLLVAGGYYGIGDNLSSAEVYNPTSGAWTGTGSMVATRDRHTATLLPNGKVLVAGGYYSGDSNSGTTNSAELYDPATGLWTGTGAMTAPRASHTATLLPNGKVLVAGGYNSTATYINVTNGADLYDPATGKWTATGAMNNARAFHTATLLLNGKVLVAGGVGPSSSAELYDPATGTWAATGALATARYWHTATLMLNGKVLVVGGYNEFTGDLSEAELYDPATKLWTAAGALNTERRLHMAVLLPNGKVLVAGGFNFNIGILSSAELYIDSLPIPTSIILTDPIKLVGGAFQFGFSNTPGATFTALIATNLTAPLSNWSALGGVTEVSSGQFRFTDPQATNNPQRFYRVRSP